MFSENTQQLAEHKLLLLYIFERFSIPLTNTQITEFIMEKEYLNYFSLQQYLTELVSSGLLEYNINEENDSYILTQKGMSALRYFKNRLSDQLIDEIQRAVEQKKKHLLKEMQIIADFTKKKENEYIVDMKAIENNTSLIELKLNVASNKQAKQICEKWKKEAPEIYQGIIHLFSLL